MAYASPREALQRPCAEAPQLLNAPVVLASDGKQPGVTMVEVPGHSAMNEDMDTEAPAE